METSCQSHPKKETNEGRPKFLSGRRKIDDEEYEYQKQRLEWGLTPDPLDIGVYKDSILRDGKVQ
jgi:hypothetical protein